MPKAADYVDRKVSVPSELRTREWRPVAAQLRERAFFMASVADAQTLDRFRSAVRAVADGELSAGQARNKLRQFLRDSGYRAEAGLEGTIKDLSTARRMRAALDTNVSLAAGWARRQRALDDPAHPGWELVRAGQARQPRDWDSRWRAAAAAVGWDGVARGGVKVALVGSPIWEELSAFGNPYPPFDWGSHMRTRAVDAATCERLGLMTDAADAAEAMQVSLNAKVEAQVRLSDAALLRELDTALSGVATRRGNTYYLNDMNGTRSARWDEIGPMIAGPLSAAARAAGVEQRQKRAVEMWCQDSRKFAPEAKGFGAATLDQREDMTRLVNRIVPTASGDEDGGPISRALSFRTAEKAQAVLDRLEKGVYSCRPGYIGESWNNNELTVRRYAKGQTNIILRCSNYRSRRRIDGLYKYLRIDKQYEGIPVASEGESIMPASVRFVKAKLISKMPNSLGGYDYEFTVEEES